MAVEQAPKGAALSAETVPGATNPQEAAASELEQARRKRPIDILREWPLSRKIATAAVLAISLALFAILILQARTADQQLLYANLSMTDASSVTTWLKSQNIPYSIKNGGRDIWVAADRIYQTRLDLAANGLPNGGDVGFEVFDKQSFALTDYVQKVNYTRALQGELARTISSLAPVESTRVHLALPEKRLFKNQQKKGTASVIVTLVPGRNLDVSQVQGIIHLVAGSVTNLEPENVKVIDSNGVMLEGEQKKDDNNLLSADMLAFQQEVEHRLEMRAQDLLDRTMGPENGMVRISATLDFSKVEKTQEFYDGDDPVVRSEQVNQENSNTTTDGGIPGVQSNLQGPQTGQGNNGPSSSKNSRITNYEISKTVSRTVNPVGNINKLSVSVLVADRVELNDKGELVKTVPRTEEELKDIENMVASAIGLSTDRGDNISVVSMPFVAAPAASEGGEGMQENILYRFMPLIKLVLIALAVLLLYFLLIRPVIKTMKGDVKKYYKTVEELEEEQRRQLEASAAENAKDEEVILPVDDAIIALRREIMQNQAPTAFILKNWIQEG